MTSGHEKALAELEREGYCRVPGVLADDVVRGLREAAFELADGARQRSVGRAGALHHRGVAYDHPRFTDLATSHSMVGLIARAVTVNIHLHHSHLDIHPPEPADDAWRWHEDGGRMTADLGVRAMLSVKVAYFLTDLETAGLGNLMVIPGSHRWTEPLRRTPGRQPDEAVPVLASAGDAVLMDRRVWHARSTNTSDRTRVVAFFAYAPRWIVQREVPPAGLLSGETEPFRRQILGSNDWDACHVARADLPVSAIVEAHKSRR